MTNDMIISPPKEQSIIFSTGDPWQAAREAWLKAKYVKNRSAHTVRTYARAIDDWLDYLAQLGRGPGQAAGVEIGDYRDMLAEEGKAPATIAQRLAAISSFYDYVRYRFTLSDKNGQTISLVKENPVKFAERPKVEKWANSQKVTYDEILTLLAAIDKTTLQGKRDFSIVTCYLFTGRRLSELARLTWGDLTFSKNGQKVTYAYKGKGGKSGTRELPPPAWAALSEYLTEAKRLATMQADSPLWVATTDAGKYLPKVSEVDPNKPLSVAMIRRLVNRYTQKALGRAISPHALRHAAAMLRLMAGDDVRAIQGFLDHSSLEMTSGYLPKLISQEDKSWQKVADLLNLEVA